jgi:hypothetical protein
MASDYCTTFGIFRFSFWHLLLHEWMLKLTERFDLTFPLPESKENVNVVPCLLPEEEPEDVSLLFIDPNIHH